MAAHDESNNYHNNPTPSDTDSTPSSLSTDENLRHSRRSGEGLTERLAAFDARLRETQAQEDAARAAYTGDCYDCRDTGILAHTPCPRCERGEALLAEQAREYEQRTVRQYLTRGGIAERRQSQTLDTYPVTPQTTEAVWALRTFITEWDGKRGLILTGSYGVGKTGLLIATLRELVRRYVPEYKPQMEYIQPISHMHDDAPLWCIPSTDFFDALRGGYNDGSYAQQLARAKRVKLLALDDLGTEKPTEWVQERLFSVVNERYEHEMPTCITTNYGLEALGERIGPRVLERLLECCDVVTVEGENLRTRA